jgi:hypothetical protein
VSNVVQLSVSITNEPGRVSEATGVLGSADVDIKGFSVSDTAEHGVLRLVVDQPDRAAAALRDGGFAVKEHDVLVIDLPDRPGGLAGVLKTVGAAGVSIEYVYSLIGTYVVVDVADADRATALLKDRPVRIVSSAEISAI